MKAKLYRIGDTNALSYTIVATRLRDGRRLMVGESTDDSDQIRETVERTLLTALLIFSLCRKGNIIMLVFTALLLTQYLMEAIEGFRMLRG